MHDPQMVKELAILIEKSGIQTPTVVVGLSFGGGPQRDTSVQNEASEEGRFGDRYRVSGEYLDGYFVRYCDQERESHDGCGSYGDPKYLASQRSQLRRSEQRFLA